MNRSLEKSNMWQLSTGRYVEEVMMQFAVKCNEEHPVWSLILDADDEEYKAYFSEAELEEIKSISPY
ncbi:hypothetical protein INT48_009109 [Thamnidium elegans]|uniref:Uncharacterized protein n=1 Tax=Thamnidium elegans TaxID=101142 RepID=A0A8H7VSV1_9FUNG|nr:hypothetical protein INT48_009109 [Thamnidium elegans]